MENDLEISGGGAGQPICRPALAFKEVQFSEMQPPTLERKWSAIVSVDASRCAVERYRFDTIAPCPCRG
jgi:hypothetical protein